MRNMSRRQSLQELVDRMIQDADGLQVRIDGAVSRLSAGTTKALHVQQTELGFIRDQLGLLSVGVQQNDKSACLSAVAEIEREWIMLKRLPKSSAGMQSHVVDLTEQFERVKEKVSQIPASAPSSPPD